MAELRRIADNSKASQGHDELAWLLNKLSKIETKVILEIGVHLGHSLKVWQDAFEPELLIGVDNERNETLDKYLEDGELVCSFVEADSTDAKTLEEVKELLGDRKVDFLFLDGDHRLEGVKSDYAMYSPLVRSGGIIAFHDAAVKDHPLVDVYKLLRTIKRHVEIFQSDANGVGVLYV